MKKILTFAILLGLTAEAAAQTFPLGNLPIGKGAGQQGWTPLAPGTAGNCVQSSGGTFVSAPCIGASGVPGGAIGAIQYNNSGAFGGFVASGDATINTGTGAVTIQANAVGASKIAPGAANTFKGSLNGTTTTDIALTACTLTYQITKWVAGTGWQCGINPVLPSRAVAATLDLSAFTSITTQGYATPGDGGDGRFVKGVTTFTDSFIASGTLTTNGTGSCTNGTLLGQIPNSPNTQAFQAAFTITVAGNVVTAITNIAPGNGYAAGTVLTFTVPGCSGAVTWTINTVTTPSGSFTDTATNKWQLLMPAAGLDVRAMGVKFDWSVAVGDAGSTDNFTTLQNAINFAAYAPGFIDTGASNGGKLLLAQGSAKFCGSNGAISLRIWNGVTVQGQGATASVIKPCDTWVNTTNFIELCDSVSHTACFSAAFRDAQLFTTYTVSQGSASALTQAAFYTNSCQHQGCGIYNATIYPGACRQGVKAEFGYGGAAMVFLINDVEIKGGMKDANCAAGAPGAVSISGYVSTLIRIDGLNIGGLSAASTFGPRSNGLAVSGGFVLVDKLYAENVIAPIIVNITGATNGFVHVKGFDSGTACVNGVLRAGGSTANTVKLEAAFANSCTNTYNNAGAASGAIVQLADVVF